MVKCPRCGAEGSIKRQRVGRREYVYVRHRQGKTERKCYLGPADEYVVVQRVYSEALAPLALTNVADVDLTQVLLRVMEAIRLQAQRLVILKRFEDLRRLYESLQRVAPELDVLIQDIKRDLPLEGEEEVFRKLEVLQV